jgi:signal transduction histidine kinase
MIHRILSLLLVVAGSALASPREDAIALVNDAAKFVQAQGAEKALPELNKPEGKWVQGDLYVFAYTMTGVMVAHPKNAKLVGKNMLDIPDVDGKFFRREILEIAKSKGSGWVDYKYKNPETGKVEPKTTYLKKVGDIVLCCGIYKE